MDVNTFLRVRCFGEKCLRKGGSSCRVVSTPPISLNLSNRHGHVHRYCCIDVRRSFPSFYSNFATGTHLFPSFERTRNLVTAATPAADNYDTYSNRSSQDGTTSTFIMEEEETTVSQKDMDLIRATTTVNTAAVSSISPQVEQRTSTHHRDFLASIPGAEKGGRKLAIVYTCGVCETRTAQKFTERAYRHGVVLCRCPGCDNLHLIADRLGYFEDPEGGGWDIQKFKKDCGEEINTITDDEQLFEFVTVGQNDDSNDNVK